MKKIKILVVFAMVSIATFYSCTDNNPIENDAVTQKSIANRTAMNELKIANNISGRNTNANASSPFCFELVYPITLSYNTGTTVTVASLQGLLTILAAETPTLYIDGIAFPFQVTTNGAIQTISTEGQYISLLLSCGFNTINTDLLNSFCFDLVFPITILNDNNEEVTITTLQQFTTYLNNPNNGGQTQFVYPISVLYNNQTTVIANLYELYQMINNCDDCICTQEFVPVCVQTPSGIFEFGNMCYAICAGYDQNDLVACDPSACNVSNLTTVITGNCNSDFSYPLTINFNYVNATSTTFNIRKSSGVLLGTYSLNDLPITIPNYTSNTNATDYLTVELNNTCSATQNWILPNCGNPSGNFSTQLGTCFNIMYPVQVQYQGALVTVTSNSQLLQYYFPAQGPIPVMNYPIVATFGNQTFTFANQAAFQSQISASCN